MGVVAEEEAPVERKRSRQHHPKPMVALVRKMMMAAFRSDSPLKMRFRTKSRTPTSRRANASRPLRALVPPSGRATTTAAAVMAMMGVAAEALAERSKFRKKAKRRAAHIPPP